MQKCCLSLMRYGCQIFQSLLEVKTSVLTQGWELGGVRVGWPEPLPTCLAQESLHPNIPLWNKLKKEIGLFGGNSFKCHRKSRNR